MDSRRNHIAYHSLYSFDKYFVQCFFINSCGRFSRYLFSWLCRYFKKISSLPVWIECCYFNYDKYTFGGYVFLVRWVQAVNAGITIIRFFANNCLKCKSTDESKYDWK